MVQWDLAGNRQRNRLVKQSRKEAEEGERENKEREAQGCMRPQRARPMDCAEIGGNGRTYISLTHSHSLTIFCSNSHTSTHFEETKSELQIQKHEAISQDQEGPHANIIFFLVFLLGLGGAWN